MSLLTTTLTADVIRIVSRGDIQQSGTGVITSNELATRQESMTTGAITLDADNQVAVFAANNAFTSGTVSFTNNQALSIGTVSALLATGKAPAFTATSGITTDAGDVSVIVNNDSLTIGEMSGGEDINAGAGSVSLNAAGVIEQAIQSSSQQTSNCWERGRSLFHSQIRLGFWLPMLMVI